MFDFDRNPIPRKLREFGLTILVGFGLIGGWIFRRHGVFAAEVMWAAAGAVGALALLFPPVTQPFYRVWMGAGSAAGFVVSRSSTPFCLRSPSFFARADGTP